MNLKTERSQNPSRRPLPLTLLLPLTLAIAGCAAAPDPAVRYIAFGDSTTAGPADTQYWQFLRDDLHQPAESFAGQGRGGEQTANGLDRLQGLLDAGLYPNARVLLYWQGGNDLIAFVHSHDPLLVLSPKAADYPFVAELAAALDTTQGNIEQAIRLGRQAGLTVYAANYFYLSAQTGQCKPALLGVLLPTQQDRVTEYIQFFSTTASAPPPVPAPSWWTWPGRPIPSPPTPPTTSTATTSATRETRSWRGSSRW